MVALTNTSINGSPTYIHRIASSRGGRFEVPDTRPLDVQFREALKTHRVTYTGRKLPRATCACGTLYCAEEGRTGCFHCEGGWQETRPKK